MSDVRPDPALARAVTFADVRSAADRLAGVAHRTPILRSRALDALTGASVFLKAECFQRIGAFKFRGAYNALSRLASSSRASGVLTYSSGNHAQAVALSAALLGIRAVIVMPEDAPRIKMQATRGYLDGAPPGSRIVTYDRHTQVREEVGRRLADEYALEIISPYDHPHVIAGQGTVALELLEDAGPLDLLLICCGGGGLLSGCAVAASELSPDCRVVGVEPEAADDAARSFRTGVLHTVSNPQTIADGARTPSLGKYTFSIVARHVHDIITVSDDDLIVAMKWAMQRMKIVIEPTGALAFAAALGLARTQPGMLRGRRIGVVLSGGNVDLDQLADLIRGSASKDSA
ncbi:MAG: threo-3-hydroxy-L-aspartate ammonia-lyase [Phycisphaeraceae bacterium]|nr:threo-3-hydroxy-L-aspartate ammonia-lyase [Phycisphaeraceae bacterium]